MQVLAYLHHESLHTLYIESAMLFHIEPQGCKRRSHPLQGSFLCQAIYKMESGSLHL